jgi:hypothetical protein
MSNFYKDKKIPKKNSGKSGMRLKIKDLKIFWKKIL